MYEWLNGDTDSSTRHGLGRMSSQNGDNSMGKKVFLEEDKDNPLGHRMARMQTRNKVHLGKESNCEGSCSTE